MTGKRKGDWELGEESLKALFGKEISGLVNEDLSFDGSTEEHRIFSSLFREVDGLFEMAVDNTCYDSKATERVQNKCIPGSSVSSTMESDMMIHSSVAEGQWSRSFEECRPGPLAFSVPPRSSSVAGQRRHQSNEKELVASAAMRMTHDEANLVCQNVIAHTTMLVESSFDGIMSSRGFIRRTAVFVPQKITNISNKQSCPTIVHPVLEVEGGRAENFDVSRNEAKGTECTNLRSRRSCSPPNVAAQSCHGLVSRQEVFEADHIPSTAAQQISESEPRISNVLAVIEEVSPLSVDRVNARWRTKEALFLQSDDVKIACKTAFVTDLRFRLREHRKDFLVAAGFEIHSRQRVEKYPESIYILPGHTRSYYCSANSAWQAAPGSLFPDKVTSAYQLCNREWTNNCDFWSDLTDTLALIESEGEDMEISERWLLLNPFVDMVFIQGRYAQLRIKYSASSSENSSICWKSITELEIKNIESMPSPSNDFNSCQMMTRSISKKKQTEACHGSLGSRQIPLLGQCTGSFLAQVGEGPDMASLDSQKEKKCVKVGKGGVMRVTNTDSSAFCSQTTQCNEELGHLHQVQSPHNLARDEGSEAVSQSLLSTPIITGRASAANAGIQYPACRRSPRIKSDRAIPDEGMHISVHQKAVFHKEVMPNKSTTYDYTEQPTPSSKASNTGFSESLKNPAKNSRKLCEIENTSMNYHHNIYAFADCHFEDPVLDSSVLTSSAKAKKIKKVSISKMSNGGPRSRKSASLCKGPDDGDGGKQWPLDSSGENFNFDARAASFTDACVHLRDGQGLKTRKGKLVENGEKSVKHAAIVRKKRFHINDDDLLIAAIIKNNSKHATSKARKMGMTSARKFKSQRGGCRLLLRTPGKGGRGAFDGKSSALYKRTILSWMIDSRVLLENEIIECRDRRNGDVLKNGCIKRDGLLCKCCNKMYSLSDFKIHAGATLYRSSLNLFLERGEPFSLCQLQAWSAEYKTRKSSIRAVESEELDLNDDTCGICADGGELICCDNCPSTFHHECLRNQLLPEGSWYCPYCLCGICNHVTPKDGILASSGDLQCAQCERRYHKACIEKNVQHVAGDVSMSPWFCGSDCQEVYSVLHSRIGSKHDVGDGFSCTLLKCIQSDQKVHSAQRFALMAECNTKLAVALTIMEECFVPMIDPRTGIDMIPHVLYNWGSNFARLNYQGFYTLALEKGDELITVASIRIHGVVVAEMPLIATCSGYRRQGMCRRLMNALEEMLISAKVERLVVSAIPELIDTWTTSFGFEPIDDSDRALFKDINLMVFPGTVLLGKQFFGLQSIGGNKIGSSCDIVRELKQPALPHGKMQPTAGDLNERWIDNNMELDGNLGHGFSENQRFISNDKNLITFLERPFVEVPVEANTCKNGASSLCIPSESLHDRNMVNCNEPNPSTNPQSIETDFLSDKLLGCAKGMTCQDKGCLDSNVRHSHGTSGGIGGASVDSFSKSPGPAENGGSGLVDCTNSGEALTFQLKESRFAGVKLDSGINDKPCNMLTEEISYRKSSRSEVSVLCQPDSSGSFADAGDNCSAINASKTNLSIPGISLPNALTSEFRSLESQQTPISEKDPKPAYEFGCTSSVLLAPASQNGLEASRPLSAGAAPESAEISQADGGSGDTFMEERIEREDACKSAEGVESHSENHASLSNSLCQTCSSFAINVKEGEGSQELGVNACGENHTSDDGQECRSSVLPALVNMNESLGPTSLSSLAMYESDESSGDILDNGIQQDNIQEADIDAGNYPNGHTSSNDPVSQSCILSAPGIVNGGVGDDSLLSVLSRSPEIADGTCHQARANLDKNSNVILPASSKMFFEDQSVEEASVAHAFDPLDSPTSLVEPKCQSVVLHKALIMDSPASGDALSPLAVESSEVQVSENEPTYTPNSGSLLGESCLAGRLKCTFPVAHPSSKDTPVEEKASKPRTSPTKTMNGNSSCRKSLRSVSVPATDSVSQTEHGCSPAERGSKGKRPREKEIILCLGYQSFEMFCPRVDLPDAFATEVHSPKSEQDPVSETSSGAGKCDKDERGRESFLDYRMQSEEFRKSVKVVELDGEDHESSNELECSSSVSHASASQNCLEASLSPGATPEFEKISQADGVSDHTILEDSIERDICKSAEGVESHGESHISPKNLLCRTSKFCAPVNINVREGEGNKELDVGVNVCRKLYDSVHANECQSSVLPGLVVMNGSLGATSLSSVTVCGSNEISRDILDNVAQQEDFHESGIRADFYFNGQISSNDPVRQSGVSLAPGNVNGEVGNDSLLSVLSSESTETADGKSHQERDYLGTNSKVVLPASKMLSEDPPVEETSAAHALDPSGTSLDAPASLAELKCQPSVLHAPHDIDGPGSVDALLPLVAAESVEVQVAENELANTPNSKSLLGESCVIGRSGCTFLDAHPSSKESPAKEKVSKPATSPTKTVNGNSSLRRSLRSLSLLSTDSVARTERDSSPATRESNGKQPQDKEIVLCLGYQSFEMFCPGGTYIRKSARNEMSHKCT